MIQKLFQSELSHNSQAQVIKELVEEAQIDPSKLKQEIEQNYEQIKPILIQHYELSLMFIITSLSIEQCFDYLNQITENNKTLILLSDVVKEKVPEKSSKLNMLFQRFTVIEKSLVMMKIYSEYSPQEPSQKQLPVFLPTFIRMAAFIIEQYLKVKNEPAKGSDDRIQTDKIIIQNSERWVSKFISQFLAKLPSMDDEGIKKFVFIGVCDLCGALLEAIREGNLKEEIVSVLLEKSVLKFFQKHYRIQEINKYFIEELRTQHYENPIKKIQIPEEYNKKVIPNTQAFAYLTLNYLSTTPIYSPHQQLLFLAAPVSEMLSRPFQIKVQLIKSFLSALTKNNGFVVRNGFEWSYPIGLLMFSFYHYEKNYYSEVRKLVEFADEEILINGLIHLKLINMPNLNSEKDQFILTQISSCKISKVRVLSLMRMIKFEGVNYECHNLLVETLQKVKEWFPEEGRGMIEEKMKEAKENKKIYEKLKQI